MRASRAVGHLAWRELRRGAIIVVVAVAALLASFVATFSATANGAFGDLGALTNNPAIRALYGVPTDISNKGGFAVWRGSTVVLVLVALWATMATTRVFRGEEDQGRWDLVLAEPLRRTATTVSHLGVLSVVGLAIGVATTVTLLAGGCATSGSLLYGAGIALFSLTFVALAAVASQLFGARRIAAGVSGAVVGGSAVIRMAADSSDANEWLRWLTPFGWVEQLQAFGADRWAPLVLLGVAPCALFAIALVLLGRRDLGEGIIRTRGSAVARTRLLGNPLYFAWRQRLGGLAGWGAGLAFYGLVMGAITAGFTKFIAGNESFRHLAAQFGMSGLTSPAGFIATGAGFLAVALAFYAVSTLGRTHEDETAGRLDLPFAAPVRRSTWLGSQVVTIAAVLAVIVLVAIVATWAGAAVGHAHLTFGDVAVATLNVVPVALVFFGLAVMLLGARPTLAVPLGVGGAVAAYALSFIGPALKWPNWVLDLTPFHHVSNAPVSPVAWTAILVLIAISVAEIGVGFVAYQRRDLA